MLVGNQLDLAHGTKERKVKKREEKNEPGCVLKRAGSGRVSAEQSEGGKAVLDEKCDRI